MQQTSLLQWCVIVLAIIGLLLPLVDWVQTDVGFGVGKVLSVCFVNLGDVEIPF